MRIVTVKFSSYYTWTDDTEEKKIATQLKKQARVDFLASLGVSISIDNAEAPTVAMTDTQYMDLLATGQERGAEVVSVVNAGHTVDSAIDKMVEISTKFEKFADKIGNSEFNEKVEVYTPGMGLMLFNRVTLLNDACSDALQAELDNGWRIIAACPQPDQRRPDYILGRFERDDEPGAQRSARRG